MIDGESKLFCSFEIVFEAGLIMHHQKQRMMLLKLSEKDKLKYLKSKIKNLKNKNYNGIPFDVILRGPLLVFFIGLIIGCLSFIIEVTVFFVLIKIQK